MPGRQCPHGLAPGFAARRVIAEWMEFYQERMPHSALGRRAPADAYCGVAGYRHVICRGRDGLTTDGYPLTGTTSDDVTRKAPYDAVRCFRRMQASRFWFPIIRFSLT